MTNNFIRLLTAAPSCPVPWLPAGRLQDFLMFPSPCQIVSQILSSAVSSQPDQCLSEMSLRIIFITVPSFKGSPKQEYLGGGNATIRKLYEFSILSPALIISLNKYFTDTKKYKTTPSEGLDIKELCCAP